MKYLLLFFILSISTSHSAFADRLETIQKRGELRVAAFDSNPPFGYLDAHTRQLVGLDIDIANAIAQKLQVKLTIVPTNPANRIPLLMSGKVDLVAANFTITPERRQQIDFSTPYFATGQGFLAHHGFLKNIEQLAKLRIGVDKGTTQELNLRKKYPQATIIAYDDTPIAFTALRNGNVQAISQDDAKLITLLANLRDKQKYELAPFTLTREYQAIGLPKGEARLIKIVDQTLIELEQSGVAQRIHLRWFGPTSKAALTRSFKIGDTIKP